MSEELKAVRAELEALRLAVLRVVEPRERQRLYEFKAAARLLGVAPKTVSRMVADGELVVTPLRGKRLISIDEIDRVSRPPRMDSSGATEEQVRFDGAAALSRLKAKRKNWR